MQKKSVLGTDPFKWMKENKKKENTENQKSDIDGQEKETAKPLDIVNDSKETDVSYKEIQEEIQKEIQEKLEGTVEEKAEEKAEEKVYEPIDVSKTLKEQENRVLGIGNVIESGDLQEEETFESSDVTEANRRVVLGQEAYSHHVKSRETTQKDSPATAFVIVYTVLLLILGFIVYRDLTKQIDKLETKLEIVEKQLDAGLINYEDTKLDDVW